MSSIDDLLSQVRSAVDARRPLCIVGGNSKHQIGREPRGERLELQGYSGIVDYQPSELVVTARAGTTVTELQQALAEKNQVLASDPPQFGGRATIGGSLACNLSGPARPWCGSIRDHVLGVRLINGRGEHLRFGGQVMKNVAGFDVSRLQAGAMGTLGIVTELSLKVMPRPESSITIKRSIDAIGALRVTSEICRKPLPLTGAFWNAGNLYVRLGGAASVVDAGSRQIAGDVLEDDAGIWSALREMDSPFFSNASDLWCVSLRPTAKHVMPEQDWLIDWRGARRWLAAPCDRESLDEHFEEEGVEAWQVRGAARDAEVFPDRGVTYQNMLRRLKAALDPSGIFNPGRLYSWL